MKIGFSATGRDLVENVYKRFAKCPVYIIYDTKSKIHEYIYNYCRYDEKGAGSVSAQILINKGVEIVITGEIDRNSYDLLQGSSIEIYTGYPGTVFEALEKLNIGKLEKIKIPPEKISEKIQVNYFNFFNKTLILDGNKRLVENFDWDFLLKQEATKSSPLNWLLPVDYSTGSYYLMLEVLKMNNTANPVEFEFVWCNLPEQEHKNIPHRCTFGPYCSFTSPGLYQHIARIDDMEKTSVDGIEEDWNWERAYDSPFVLIKPYGQNPFPVEFKIAVYIFE